MSNEREIRKETDLWGNEKEVIYQDGEKVGEIHKEERGGFLGFGAETTKVEYDRDHNEVSHTTKEDRGGFFGIGEEEVDVKGDIDGNEISSSKVEERGGFLGIGSHHVRAERGPDGNIISESNHERRGDFFGFGGEKVRVTRYESKNSSSNSSNAQQSSVNCNSPYQERSGGTYSPKSSSHPTNAPNGATGWIIAVLVMIFVVLVASHLSNGERAKPLPSKSPGEIAAEQRRIAAEQRKLDEQKALAREALLQKFNFLQWDVGKTLKLHGGPVSFCTRPCGYRVTGQASIRLVSITKTSTGTISLRFSVKTSPKNQYLPGNSKNKADNDYLLFVMSDSYTREGFSSSPIESLYAEAMHLSDDQGNKYKSLGGIEGIEATEFNRHAYRAILPFDTNSYFNINFPIPNGTPTSLKFISPRLHGHQDQWHLTIYDSNRF